MENIKYLNLPELLQNTKMCTFICLVIIVILIQVYPYIDVSPCTMYMETHYTIMPVSLQQTSWWWTYKSRNM